MSTNQFLIDASTRHQVFLQRYGGGQSKKALKTLNRLRRDINARLSQELEEIQRNRLTLLLADIDSIYQIGFGQIKQGVKVGAFDLSQSEARFSVDLFSKATSFDFVMPADAALMQSVELLPMSISDGVAIDIDAALTDYGAKKVEQIKQTIADGVTLGDTTPEISAKVGELMNTLQRRQLDTLVRTVTNHTSSVARREVFKANEDVLDGYKWIATLDNRTTLICMSRDHQVYKNPDSDPMPPAHWNCVLGSTFITSALGVSAATKRIFKGEVITIDTVSGNKLTLTPNHPVLISERGWVPAKFVNVGDKCFHQSVAKGVGSVDGDNDSGFMMVEDVFESLRASGEMVTSEVVISSPDFHNDGIDNEVAEICATCDLSPMFDIGITEPIGDDVLDIGDASDIDPSLQSFGHLRFFGEGFGATSSSNIGGFNELLPVIERGSIHSGLLLCGSSSDGNSVFSEDSLYGSWADTELLRNTANTYAGGIKLDDVVSVEVSDFCGHVYNLQTIDHCYSANGIITHNCRSTTVPVVNPAFNLGAKVKGERASKGAGGGEAVSANLSYGSWLKKQPREFVDEALGVERSRLFRSGKLSIDKFVDPTGRVYTLSELERMNPFVFMDL